MLNKAHVSPTGSGGRFFHSERRENRSNAAARRDHKVREHYAYRNAIPLLFKGEERFRGLTINETIVLAAMMRRARHEYGGKCWPTHEQLVSDLHGGISVRQITRVVGSLRDKDWISIETVHSNQILPSGRAVVGGERNVYAVNLARITGVTIDVPSSELVEDGRGVHPRNAEEVDTTSEIAEENGVSTLALVDQEFNKLTDPQRDVAPAESANSVVETIVRDEADVSEASDSAETVACIVLAYWMRTAFPEYAEREGRVDLAAGSHGNARVARILALLQRGFEPQTLRDAILGATMDKYAREAGCPLGLVFGDKIFHYARAGRNERMRLTRIEERDRVGRGRAAAPRAAPQMEEPLSAERMLADISRIFGGGAAASRPVRDLQPMHAIET